MKIKGILTAAAMLLSVMCCQLPSKAVSAKAVVTASESTDNPCNKQNDMEVPYDGSRWIQPVEWNVPTVRPRDYKGGIMLFFDKIGLDPETASGRTQRVYFSVHGATEPVSYIKFHIFYDTRLKVKENSQGELVNAGKAIKDFTTGSALVEDGQIAFYAYKAEDTLLDNASIFTIDFILPENAEAGDVYPIGLAYVDDGIVADCFINNEKDAAGRLQMTYVFTKGIYNGYIKMNGEKKPKYSLGDVNNDGAINAVDASAVLTYYAMISTNKKGDFDENQKLAADVDNNGSINAVDASCILSYYAYVSTTKDDPVSFEEYMKNT
ncbi:dockerin type I domain-containing protein [uncultured Ruminococcus sp.]|uniref:dockerin type I domain-containing protein n=1 Tax=uncultured Ruminococcus sp. TaxID=165186 RepID=UPI0025FBF4F9|nr:dockerin type I domain-containing protein [uncultured Ruminococcus sp.]